jgi:hypothetical protein
MFILKFLLTRLPWLCFFFLCHGKHFLGKLFVLTVLGFRAHHVRSGPAVDLKASIAPHLLSLLLVRSVAADPAASFPFHLKGRPLAACPAPDASVSTG